MLHSVSSSEKGNNVSERIHTNGSRKQGMMGEQTEKYYAVIFTSQREDVEMELYGLTSDRMIELARHQPGFLGVESVREENGLGITVSYWRDQDSIRAWGEHAEHKVAQKLGRQKFYSWFKLRIAKVFDEQSFRLDDLPGSSKSCLY